MSNSTSWTEAFLQPEESKNETTEEEYSLLAGLHFNNKEGSYYLRSWRCGKNQNRWFHCRNIKRTND